MESKQQEKKIIVPKENDALFLEGKKRCSKCHEIKPIEGNFKKNRHGHKGLDAKCNRCHSKYMMEKRKTDELFAFETRCRSSVREAFNRKGYTKDSHTHELLCAPYPVVLTRLTKGGIIPVKGNEIDHIVPISAAISKREVEILCHYTNLQLLSPEANNKKSNILPSIFDLPSDLNSLVFDIWWRMI